MNHYWTLSVYSPQSVPCCAFWSLSGPILTSGAQVHVHHHRCLCASYLNTQGPHCRLLPWGGWAVDPDLSRVQLPLQKKPFRPKGNTKTGHTSIKISLIKRETKAQHLSRKQTMVQSLNGFKSKLEQYIQSCCWTPSAKDKAAQTNRSRVLVKRGQKTSVKIDSGKLLTS